MSRLSDDMMAGLALLPKKEKLRHGFFHYGVNALGPEENGKDYEVVMACAMGAALVGHDQKTLQTVGNCTTRIDRYYEVMTEMIILRDEHRAMIVASMREDGCYASAAYWASKKDVDSISLYRMIEILNDETELTIPQIAEILKSYGY